MGGESDKELTKVDNLGLLRKWKLSKPLNMQSFGHPMFILSQLYWCLLPTNSLTNLVKEYALIKKCHVDQ